MDKTTTDIGKGDLLTIATGEYSDYSVLGVFRALKQFNPDVEVKRYKDSHPTEDGDEYRELSDFVAWLGAEGLVETVPSREWHIGSYGRLEPFVY